MKKLKVLAGIYFVMFVFAGLGFLLFPNGTIYLFNAITDILNLGFSKLNYNNAFFYNALALGYMTVVSVISLLVYIAPEKNYRLFIPLIIGKASTSLFSLMYFIIHTEALIYLTNFIVDGAIAIIGYIVYKNPE